MIRGQDLKKVKVGQTVVTVCGPGDFPRPGLCSRMGVVIGHDENRFGVSLLIKFEDGSDESVHRLAEPDDQGIGTYAYPAVIE